MDVVVERLANSLDGHSVREIFVPPEAPVTTLGAVLNLAASNQNVTLADPQPFGRLRVPIGLVLDAGGGGTDEPLFLDLSDNANVGMVGAPGMGRSTFLRTVLGALILTHAPRDLRIACVDLGGGGLAEFSGAPHLLTPRGAHGDMTALNVVAAVRSLIDERQAAVLREGVASFAELEARDAGDTPQVVLALDDVSAMGADALDGLSDIVRRGASYGVTIIATAGSWLEVPADIRSALGHRMELRLKVPRHSVIDAVSADTVPPVPGQGLVPPGTRTQIAVPRLDVAGDATDLDQAVRDVVVRATAIWATPRGRHERTDGDPAPVPS